MQKIMLIAAAGALWLWSRKNTTAQAATGQGALYVPPVMIDRAWGIPAIPSGDPPVYTTPARTVDGVSQSAPPKPEVVFGKNVMTIDEPPIYVTPPAPIYVPPPPPPPVASAAAFGGTVTGGWDGWIEPTNGAIKLSDGRTINAGTLRLGLA